MIKNLEIDHRIAVGGLDMDGNLFNTTTPVYLRDATTGENLSIAWYMLDQNPDLIHGESAPYTIHEDAEASYYEFRDFSPLWMRGADGLVHDVREAIEHWLLAPSFEAFKHTFLIKARFFAIITARGHSMENLERAIRIINDITLTAEEKKEQHENIRILWNQRYPHSPSPSYEMLMHFYFGECCGYYGVSSPHLCNLLNIPQNLSSALKKTHAMQHYIRRVRWYVTSYLGYPEETPLNIGFSDDSIKNIEAMETFFRQSPDIQPNDKVRIYYTGNASLSKQLLSVPHISQENMHILKIQSWTVL